MARKRRNYRKDKDIPPEAGFILALIISFILSNQQLVLIGTATLVGLFGVAFIVAVIIRLRSTAVPAEHLTASHLPSRSHSRLFAWIVAGIIVSLTFISSWVAYTFMMYLLRGTLNNSLMLLAFLLAVATSFVVGLFVWDKAIEERSNTPVQPHISRHSEPAAPPHTRSVYLSPEDNPWTKPIDISPQPTPIYPPPPPDIRSTPEPKPAPYLNIAETKRWVHNMDPSVFEVWVRDMLLEIGWSRAEVVGGRGDRGVDIKGMYRGQSAIVQCKHYTSKKVSPTEIRGFIGTMNVQKVLRGYFVTSSDFTPQCYEEAKQSGYDIELWNLDNLLQEVRRARSR